MYAPSAGLYKEGYERDSCGFGLIASLDDAPSHWLVRTAISSLIRLTHRGAIAADGKTGDGCGLLLKRPEGFLRAVAAEAGIELAQGFASGLVFPSRQALQAEQARLALARELARQGLEVAGWRAVPVDAGACGAEALKSLPLIEQLFVNCLEAGLDEAAFNRRLFMARRLAEKATSGDPAFHVPSLSANTIVFKGMVMPQHLAQFYPDLADPRLESSVAVFHQRFSTNTLPQWRLAHPFRFLAHNGEINTIQGNRNWMKARESDVHSPELTGSTWLKPLIQEGMSDSASLDNAVELLAMSGRDLTHSMAMLMPPAWENDEEATHEPRAFFEYHSCLMEPWDGPATVVFTDGRIVGAALDRNGLRPARYLASKDGLVVVSSEVGVVDIEEDRILSKGRLGPGDIVAVDLRSGAFLQREAIHRRLAARRPYPEWLRARRVTEVPPASLSGRSGATVPDLNVGVQR